MKKLTLPNGITVEVTEIKDIENYRGHYVIIEKGAIKTYLKATFNSCGAFITGYSRGYELIEDNILAHLHNKIRHKDTLSKYEKEDFYEKVNLVNGFARSDGKLYDFSSILNKIPGIPFHILGSQPSRREKKIFDETPFHGHEIDINELVSLVS